MLDTILAILVVWLIGSIPLGLLIGGMLRRNHRYETAPVKASA